MAIARLTYDLCLTVCAPFLFRGLAQSALGVDNAALRDLQGRPIIPADQVRGVFKDMLRELPDGLIESACGLPLDALFGQPSSGEDKHNLPQRRRIHFTDLTDLRPQGQEESHHHTRVEIDDVTGSVKTGALQVVELVAKMGQEVAFKGSIQIIADRERAASIETLLTKALALVGSIGSIKSAGFGEMIASASSVTLNSEQSRDLPNSLAAPDPWPHGDRLTLAVTFDRPLLFNSARLAENAISSASVIPGAAFKGALADSLALGLGDGFKDEAITQTLTALHFSHAYPVDQDGRALGHALPQSLVAVKTDGDVLYGDAIHGALGSGAMLGDKPALNVGDWKGPWYGGASETLGWPTADAPPTQARTHTAINPKTGSALSEQLFTTHLQSERYPDGTACEWRLTVDLGRLSAGPLRQNAQAMVQILLDRGLSGMGGTGATASFSVVAQGTDLPIPPQEGPICLRLLTPALLAHANDIWPDDQTEISAPEVYGAYFTALHPDIRLKAAFARQALAGGYQARRRRAYGDYYFPFVVTEPGAVFLLDCPTAEARQVLADAQRWGLPPAPYRHDGEITGMTWETCPYMPENGFGAVMIDDLAVPTRKALIEGVEHV
jgi:hypothetical protein